MKRFGLQAIVRDPCPYLSLAAIALTHGLAYGIWYAYRVFLVARLGEFGWGLVIRPPPRSCPRW